MRQAGFIKFFKDHLQRRYALWIGLANDNRRVACRERQRAFVRELNRARAIYEGEGFIEKGNVGNVKTNAHGVIAGLGGSISDG